MAVANYPGAVVDTEMIAGLNGPRALKTLNDWARGGELALLADAAISPEVQPGSRFFAVRHLQHFTDEPAISVLVQALTDNDARVRGTSCSLAALDRGIGARSSSSPDRSPVRRRRARTRVRSTRARGDP